MKLWAMPCRATQDGLVKLKSSDKIWFTGKGIANYFSFLALRTPWTVWKDLHINIYLIYIQMQSQFYVEMVFFSTSFQHMQKIEFLFIYHIPYQKVHPNCIINQIKNLKLHSIMVLHVAIVLQLLSCIQHFCTLMDFSPPGSSIHGISQARIPDWVAISFSRSSPPLRDQIHDSYIGRWVLYHWTTWEAHDAPQNWSNNLCLC